MPNIVPHITAQPLPYVLQLTQRPIEQIQLVVLHCTELPDITTAREYGEHILYPSGTGNSGHYYIDRDGSTYSYVPHERIAHHVKDRNDNSLGIELVNTGRYPHWLDSRHQQPQETYPQPQITALINLLQWLPTQLPNLLHITGHENLDTTQVPATDNPNILVARKLDPGPHFPWAQVLSAIALTQPST